MPSPRPSANQEWASGPFGHLFADGYVPTQFLPFPASASRGHTVGGPGVRGQGAYMNDPTAARCSDLAWNPVAPDFAACLPDPHPDPHIGLCVVATQECVVATQECVVAPQECVVATLGQGRRSAPAGSGRHWEPGTPDPTSNAILGTNKPKTQRHGTSTTGNSSPFQALSF